MGQPAPPADPTGPTTGPPETAAAHAWGRLTGFRLDPEPPQGPAVPLMVGGNGDRLLAKAARLAQIVQFAGFTPGASGNDYQKFSDDGLADRIAHVRDRAGDRFPGLELSILVQSAGVVPDPADAVSWLRSVDAGILTADEALRAPFVQVASSADELGDRLVALRERHGISYVTVFDGRAPHFDRVVTRLAGT